MVANPSHAMRATTVVGRGEIPMMQRPFAICVVIIYDVKKGDENGQ